MKSVSALIKDIFANPTAPYREGWVLESIKKELERLKVDFFQDNWGNIFAGVKNPQALKTSRRVALVAHTDHPGFHILGKKRKGIYRAQWFGGHPPKMLGAKVAIHHPLKPQFKITGLITSAPDSKKIFEIKVKESGFELTKDCFGAFDFPGSRFSGTKITTRAADDLAGAVIILGTLARLNKNERHGFLGIFTVAEETGFKGTLGLLRNKTLGQNITGISLEASRQMEGARIGEGPVIRLGDRKTIFDNRITSLLDLAAEELKKSKKLKFQKRVMNGGTCEATAFNLFGVPCGGLAVPLGNYHNQKSNGKPGPEFINLKDVETAVALCVRFYKNQRSKRDPLARLSKILMGELKSSEIHFKRKINYASRI